MKIKRILAALLLGCMLLSSCGQTPPDGGDGIETTTADTAAAETVTTDYLETLPETDFEGRTFTILAQHTPERFNFAQEEKTGDVINDSIIERDTAVEELLNITYARLPYTDRGKLKTDASKTILAGDEAYNLIITSMSDGINTLAPQGVLYDLKELPYVQLESSWWNKSIYDGMQIEGRLFFTTGAISPCFFLTPIVSLFNKRLVENYGLGDIYGMVNDGSWTFDNFYDMTKDLTQDVNNDGLITKDDFFGYISDSTLGGALFEGAGLKQIEIKNGEYKMALDTEKAIEVIMKYSNAYGDKTRFMMEEGGSTTVNPMFKNGQAVFTSMNVYGFAIPYRDMEDDYGIVPLPKYDESIEGYSATCNTWLPTGVAVPINCSDPEFNGLVMEATGYISQQYVAPAVYETALRGKATRDSESYQILEMIFNNCSFDMNTVFNFGGSSELLRASVCGIKTNFVSDYAAIKDKSQAALDNMIAMVREVYK